MTQEEWAELARQLVAWCWPYSTQQDRLELLTIQARINAAVKPPEPPRVPAP